MYQNNQKVLEETFSTLVTSIMKRRAAEYDAFFKAYENCSDNEEEDVIDLRTLEITKSKVKKGPRKKLYEFTGFRYTKEEKKCLKIIHESIRIQNSSAGHQSRFSKCPRVKVDGERVTSKDISKDLNPDNLKKKKITNQATLNKNTSSSYELLEAKQGNRSYKDVDSDCNRHLSNQKYHSSTTHLGKGQIFTKDIHENSHKVVIDLEYPIVRLKRLDGTKHNFPVALECLSPRTPASSVLQHSGPNHSLFNQELKAEGGKDVSSLLYSATPKLQKKSAIRVNRIGTRFSNCLTQKANRENVSPEFDAKHIGSIALSNENHTFNKFNKTSFLGHLVKNTELYSIENDCSDSFAKEYLPKLSKYNHGDQITFTKPAKSSINVTKWHAYFDNQDAQKKVRNNESKLNNHSDLVSLSRKKQQEKFPIKTNLSDHLMLEAAKKEDVTFENGFDSDSLSEKSFRNEIKRSKRDLINQASQTKPTEKVIPTNLKSSLKNTPKVLKCSSPKTPVTISKHSVNRRSTRYLDNVSLADECTPPSEPEKKFQSSRRFCL